MRRQRRHSSVVVVPTCRSCWSGSWSRWSLYFANFQRRRPTGRRASSTFYRNLNHCCRLRRRGSCRKFRVWPGAKKRLPNQSIFFRPRRQSKWPKEPLLQWGHQDGQQMTKWPKEPLSEHGATPRWPREPPRHEKTWPKKQNLGNNGLTNRLSTLTSSEGSSLAQWFSKY